MLVELREVLEPLLVELPVEVASVAQRPDRDELPGAPGASIRRLLREAAALRDACRPWEEVADRVERPYNTVTKWPARFPERWHYYTQEAARRRGEQFEAMVQRLNAAILEGGLEAVVILRSLMRGKLVEARDGSRGDEDEAGRLMVSSQVRESAAHSLMSAVQKLTGERHVLEVHDATERQYAEMDDEELIERAYPGLREVR